MTARTLPVSALSLAVLLAACSPAATPSVAGSGGRATTTGGSQGTGLTGTGGNASETGGAVGSGGAEVGSGGSGTETGGGSASGGAVGTGTGGAGNGGSPSGGAQGPTGGSGPIPDGSFARPVGTTPNKSWPATMVNVPKASWMMDVVSPSMNNRNHHNQSSVVNGYLVIGGNEFFWIWDISDPANPKQLSTFATPNRMPTAGGKGEGEAESHTTSFARYGNKFYMITTGGRGVDTWDITEPTKPVHVQQIILPGIDYGD